MYGLSIMATIFLPLGFLTGFFGINVGGIPGTENNLAFTFFVGTLVIIGLGLFFFLKRKRWF